MEDVTVSVYDMRDMVQTVHDMNEDPRWRAACKRMISALTEHAAITEKFGDIDLRDAQKCLNQTKKHGDGWSWNLACSQMALEVDRMFNESSLAISPA